MRYKYLLALIAVAVLLFSCKKDESPNPPPPSPLPAVFLKDIVIPNLPSPYYYFEYDNAGKFTKVSHASDIRMYDVVYTGNRITELKNNTTANKDRLVYLYDDQGRVNVIQYINNAGVFRRCYLAFRNGQLQEVEWERKVNVGFAIDRILEFDYYADGNLLEITDHRFPIPGDQHKLTYVDRFEQYDNKVNTDAFSLLHDNNDHLFLLPGIVLQKNNPRKVIRSGDGNNYTIDYSYTYNDKNAPLTKKGDGVFTSGPNTGQQFQANASFSYY